MNLNLKIEGVSVDLAQGSNITLQKNSNIFGAPDKIQTSKSYTITLPFTLTNEAVMQHLELPSVATSFLTTAKTATLEAEGLPIFKGKIVLLSIEKDGYQVALTFGELTALAAMISDNRKISELGIDEVWLDWLNTTPFEDASDVDYALYEYNYGMTYDATKAQVSYSAQMEYALGLISTFYGITFNYDVDIWEGYLILTKNLNVQKDETPGLGFGISGTSIVSPYISENDLGNAFYVCKNSFNWIGFYAHDVSKVSKLFFEIFVTESSALQINLIHFDKNNDVKDTYPLSMGLNNVEVDASTIAVDDFFSVGTAGGLIDSATNVTFELNTGEAYPLSSTLLYKIDIENQGSFYTNMQFPIIANLDFTAVQLLKEIQLFNGLYSTSGATTTEIDLTPFDDLADRSSAQNVSNMFISLEKSEFSYESWGKYNQFSYKESDGEITADYNTCLFLLTNYQLKESAGLASILGTGANEIPIRINQYSINDSGETVKNNLPLIYAEKVGDFLQAVPFRDILQNRYDILIKSLQNFRICTINLHLSHLEYNTFNVNKMIYLKQIGKYFYPISADYNPSNKILVVKAILLGSLADDITLTEIPLSQSAQATASGAASLAQSTYALVVGSYQEKILKSDGNTVAVADWVDDTGTSGFWYADISNASITASYRVEATPTKETETIYSDAGAVAENESFTGYVRIYADTQPADDIIFNLEILKIS